MSIRNKKHFIEIIQLLPILLFIPIVFLISCKQDSNNTANKEKDCSNRKKNELDTFKFKEVEKKLFLDTIYNFKGELYRDSDHKINNEDDINKYWELFSYEPMGIYKIENNSAKVIKPFIKKIQIDNSEFADLSLYAAQEAEIEGYLKEVTINGSTFISLKILKILPSKKFISHNELIKYSDSLCDYINIAIIDLYPIAEFVPAITEEKLYLNDFLINSGFKLDDYGWGNGPEQRRFIYRKYILDSCTCIVNKHYYYHQKIDGEFYNMKIVETLLCNDTNLAQKKAIHSRNILQNNVKTNSGKR